MNVGDRVPLRCGHHSRVIWMSDDAKTMTVQGSWRRCDVCYKNHENPNVYLCHV